MVALHRLARSTGTLILGILVASCNSKDGANALIGGGGSGGTGTPTEDAGTTGLVILPEAAQTLVVT
jgi:hypothetical protein